MNSPPLSNQRLAEILALLSQQPRFAFFETSKPSDEEQRNLLFLEPVALLTCAETDPTAAFLSQAQAYLDRGFFLAGWLAYEFGYGLEPTLRHLTGRDPMRLVAEFGVFPPPLVVTAEQPLPARLTIPPPREESHTIANLRPNLSQEQYLGHLARIKEYLASGDTYQVNYTLKLLFDFTGSPAALYRVLRRNQPVAYGAYLKLAHQQILSFSPELFFRRQGRDCQVRPMKGTCRRGRTLAEDRNYAAQLQSSAKNRSENVMIVDLLRNDLGRICELGTVTASSLFAVETYQTLHQMTSTVHGTLKAKTSLSTLFQALFPCGSVTGTPKIRTMEIIRELETSPRGVYTGAIGYLAPNGDAVFNVPIRTVVLDHGRGEMGIGSGIVHDSDPAGEWRECLLKGQFLSQPQADFQLIETLLWRGSQGYWLLELHLDRLLESAEYFAFPAERETIRHALRTAIPAAEPEQTLRVRLLLSQDGQVQITTVPCAPPTTFGLPTLARKNRKAPTIVLARQGTTTSNRYLYHKTTCRARYDEERELAIAAGHQEVIFRNEHEELTEGSISNLFIQRGEILLTPPQECGLLNGTLRRHLLATYPDRVREQILRLPDLAAADAIYLGNSVRGLYAVTWPERTKKWPPESIPPPAGKQTPKTCD